MDGPEGLNTSVLHCERVTVRFGQLAAVDDVSISIRGGHLLGLIGPNGAGKTTLLRVAAGLQQPDAGIVKVLDEPVVPGAGIMRHIGFTADNPAVYEELTVRQFLQFIAHGYDIAPAEARERIDFWLEKVWLADKATQKIKGLSRGMRQRIGIARTLLPNPSLVLLDEPAAGLDPAGRVQFRQLLCDLRDQGKALIVSSHILSDMNEYCSHVAIMHRGKIVRHGTVDEIANHHHAEQARYMLSLARPIVELNRIVAEIEGAQLIEHDRLRATILYTRGDDAAAALLEQLIARRVPIASFVPSQPDLEQAYLMAGIAQVE